MNPLGINRWRKFTVAMFFAITGAAALFLGKFTGGEYVALATIVLGLFAGADVYEKQVCKP